MPDLTVRIQTILKGASSSCDEFIAWTHSTSVHDDAAFMAVLERNFDVIETQLDDKHVRQLKIVHLYCLPIYRWEKLNYMHLRSSSNFRAKDLLVDLKLSEARYFNIVRCSGPYRDAAALVAEAVLGMARIRKRIAKLEESLGAFTNYAHDVEHWNNNCDKAAVFNMLESRMSDEIACLYNAATAALDEMEVVSFVKTLRVSPVSSMWKNPLLKTS